MGSKGRPASSRAVPAKLQLAKTGASRKVIAEPAAHQEPAGKAEEDAPVRRAHRYLSRRPDQPEDAAALRRELPIGSGLIKSGNQHVLQARLKLPGCALATPKRCRHGPASSLTRQRKSGSALDLARPPFPIAHGRSEK